MERRNWSPEELARRRKRSIAIALILVAIAVLLFVTTIVRMSGNGAAPGG